MVKNQTKFIFIHLWGNTMRIVGILFLSFLISSCNSSSSNTSSPKNNTAPATLPSPSAERQTGEESSTLKVKKAIEGAWKAGETLKCSDGTLVDESRYSSIIMTINNGIFQMLNDLIEPTGCQKTVTVPFKISAVSRSSGDKVTGLDVLLGEGRSSYSAACHSRGNKVVERSSIHIKIISKSLIMIDEPADRSSSCFDLAFTRSYSRIQ